MDEAGNTADVVYTKLHTEVNTEAYAALYGPSTGYGPRDEEVRIQLRKYDDGWRVEQ